jgi:hypothetical protein
MKLQSKKNIILMKEWRMTKKTMRSKVAPFKNLIGTPNLKPSYN